MENESTEGQTLSLELPAALDEWLTERASDLDVDRSELIIQLIGGYQVAADTEAEASVESLEEAIQAGTVDIDGTVQEAIEDTVASAAQDEDEFAARVADQVDSRLDALEAEMDEKLDDVRRRVVQVKQETDAKAPADHTHPGLEGGQQAAEEIESLRERVADLETQVGDGADLASELEDVEGKLTQLARAVVRMRDSEEDDRDERLASIKRTAAREGYEQASCGACGESVRVGLLPEATCPHCESPFGDIVDSSGGLFGSSPRLVGPHEEGGGEPRPGGSTEAGADGEDEVPDITPEASGSDGTGLPGEPDEDSEESATGDDGSAVSTDGGNHD